MKDMRNLRIVLFSIMLGASMVLAAQPGFVNNVGNGLSSFLNLNNQSDNGSNSDLLGLTSYTYPGHQNQYLPFDTELQQMVLEDSLPLVDGGLSQRSHTTLSVGSGQYFDFETGYSSSEYFTTADFYISADGRSCPLVPEVGAGALNLGVTDFDSVDYSNSKTHLGSTLCSTDPTPTVVTFLFDESHNSYGAYNIAQNLKTFYNMVLNSGHVAVVHSTGEITNDVLSGINVYVVYLPQTAYTEAELTSLIQFYKTGGNLLLIGDNGQLSDVVNQFSSTIGFEFAQNTMNSEFNTGRLIDLYLTTGYNILSDKHPVTQGVSELELIASNGLNKVAYGAITLVHTRSDGSDWWNNGTSAMGVSLISALDSSNHGKVLVLSDVNIFDVNYISDFDNMKLAQNSIDWLASGNGDGRLTTPITEVGVLKDGQATDGGSKLIPLTNYSVVLWKTLEGNFIRAQYVFGETSVDITYDYLYYISINGNDDLLQKAAVYGWLGDGTAENPIVITGFDLNMYNVGGFSVTNTDLFVVFQENAFNGFGSSVSGISMNNVQHVSFVSNNVSGYLQGLLVENSADIFLNGNNIEGNSLQGVFIFNSSGVSVTENNLSNNGGSGLTAHLSSWVSVVGNTFNSNSLMIGDNPTLLSGILNFVQSFGEISGNTLTNGFGFGIFVLGVGLTSSDYSDAVVAFKVQASGSTFDISENDVSSNQQAGIAVWCSDFVSVTNNSVNVNAGAGLSVSSSTHVRLIGNQLAGNGEDGIFWIHSSYGVIRKNKVSGNSNLALRNAKTGKLSLSLYSGLFMDPSFYNEIGENDFSGNGVGVKLVESGFNNISSNTITSNAENGLEIIDSSSNAITNNDISANSEPYLALALSKLTKPGSLTLSLYSGLFMDPSYNNVISGNNISNNYGYGIQLESSDNNTVDSNQFTGNGAHGAFIVDSNYNDFTNNDFSENSALDLQTVFNKVMKPGSLTLSLYSGLFMDPSSYNTVSDNIFDNNFGKGVHVLESDNNTFGMNEITNNALDGFFLENSNGNQIAYNTISGNSNPEALAKILSFGKPTGLKLSLYSGLFMDPSQNNQVFGNTIEGNYGNGAVVESSDNNLLTGNSLTGNAGDGIAILDSDGNTISKNTISANSNPVLQLKVMNVLNTYKPGSVVLSLYSGLFMDPSSGNIVSDNVIENNPGYGVWIQSSNENVFDGNLISNSGQDGVFVENSNYNTIKNNDISGSGNSDILGTFLSYGKPSGLKLSLYSGLFMDPSTGNVLDNNNIHDNNGYGVQSLDSDGNSLHGNKISFNKDKGLLSVNSNKLTIKENSFSYNDDYGVYFDANSKDTNLEDNDFIANALGQNKKQGFDDGGNSVNHNFYLDGNPNSDYLFDGSSKTKDSAVSITPKTDLRNLHFEPIEVDVKLHSRSFNVKSEGRYLSAWIHFPDGYSAYLVNKTTLSVEWNGNEYHVIKSYTFGSHWMYIKFDKKSLGHDVYAFLKANKLDKTVIDLTIHGEFNGGFLSFFGTDSITAFKYKYHNDHDDDHHDDHDRGRH
jgi:parallel beta-helix repeat protein